MYIDFTYRLISEIIIKIYSRVIGHVLFIKTIKKKPYYNRFMVCILINCK